MKTLKESLFDKDLTDKLVGHCLADVAELTEILIFPPKQHKSYLEYIDWDGVKKEMKRWNIGDYPKQDITSVLQINYENLAPENKEYWDNALNFANLLLNIKMSNKFVRRGYKFDKELEKYLSRFVSVKWTYFEVGQLTHYIHVKLICPKNKGLTQTQVIWKFIYK